MFHYKNIETNVLTSFFDPALLSTGALRKDFIESSITYLIDSRLAISSKDQDQFSISPNPSSDEILIRVKNATESSYNITSVNGLHVLSSEIFNGNANVSISNLNSGIYFLTVNGHTRQIVKL